MRLQGTCPPPLFRESISWIISPFKFWTATIFLHAHLQVVYYKCVKFHKNPISRLGGVALTRYMDGRTGWFLYTPPNFVCRGYNKTFNQHEEHIYHHKIALQKIMHQQFAFSTFITDAHICSTKYNKLTCFLSSMEFSVDYQ